MDYDRLCGTCGYALGEHFGPDDASDCPVTGSDGESYRNPNVEQRTYFQDTSYLDPVPAPAPSDADREAASRIIGVLHPERWTPPDPERVPMQVHPEARDALRELLIADPALTGVGFSEFIMRAVRAWEATHRA